MFITRQKFQVVSVKAVRRWKTQDGRAKQETKVFSQTLNPFNTYAGKPKTREQILVEINRERALWLAQGAGVQA